MNMLAKDIAAFVNVLGVEEPDLVWYLATLPWQSESDRNGFILEIANLKGPVAG